MGSGDTALYTIGPITSWLVISLCIAYCCYKCQCYKYFCCRKRDDLPVVADPVCLPVQHLPPPDQQGFIPMASPMQMNQSANPYPSMPYTHTCQMDQAPYPAMPTVQSAYPPPPQMNPSPMRTNPSAYPPPQMNPSPMPMNPSGYLPMQANPNSPSVYQPQPAVYQPQFPMYDPPPPYGTTAMPPPTAPSAPFQ